MAAHTLSCASLIIFSNLARTESEELEEFSSTSRRKVEGLSAAGTSFSIIGDCEEEDEEGAWIRNSGLLEVGSLEAIRGKHKVRSVVEREKGTTAAQEEEEGAVSPGISIAGDVGEGQFAEEDDDDKISVGYILAHSPQI